MPLLVAPLVALIAFAGVGCGGSDAGGSGGASTASATAAGSGGGGGAACVPSFEGDTVHLAVGATVAGGTEQTVCLRWTAPEDIDVDGFVGTLGPMGHHLLLLGDPEPTEPDGVATCSETELMDAQTYGTFQMLAGVSYETDGQAFDFPASPVQVGLSIPKGMQVILDTHFLNTAGDAAEGCATLDLDRGKPVVAKLQFRTVLPAAEYDLVVPASGKKEATYSEPVGGRFRVAAASSHMHAGGTHFRMSVAETDQTLFETDQWAEPVPAIFDTQKIVVEPEQTFQLDCSFENVSTSDQHFPAQMCVGGMYLLPCTLPGAC